MKALIFFERANKKQELKKVLVENMFGKLSHFEKVGMVLSLRSLDLRGLSLYSIESGSSRFTRIKTPSLSTKVLTYYISTDQQ